ncbi:hypothetical protein A9970_22280 [Sphingobacterium sp. UME9]|nr:hypothetical protein [Sphingobacterium sp. UME9]
MNGPRSFYDKLHFHLLDFQNNRQDFSISNAHFFTITFSESGSYNTPTSYNETGRPAFAMDSNLTFILALDFGW